MRVAVMHDIQPVPRPTLAIARRLQHRLDQRLISLRIRIGYERIDRCRIGRQAEQIEREPPIERAPIGRRRRREPPFKKLRLNEGVNGRDCDTGTRSAS